MVNTLRLHYKDMSVKPLYGPYWCFVRTLRNTSTRCVHTSGSSACSLPCYNRGQKHTHLLHVRLALTFVSGHYSGQGVKLTNHLRIVLRVGMRGALPRLFHTPAVIEHCIIQPKDNFAFPLKVDAIAEHDTEGLPSPHTVANSLFAVCPVVAQKFC